MPTVTSAKPIRMIELGRRSPARFPARRATREHAQRQRRQRQAGLHGVVLEDHLQEDRQGDHQPAEGDLLHHLPRDPEPERLPTGTGQGRSASACQRACAGPATRRAAPWRWRRRPMSAATDSPPSCQTRMPSTIPPMPTTDSTDPTTSTDRGPVYGTSRTSLMPDEHERDDQRLEQEGDPPREVRRDEPAEQRTDRGGDGCGRPDQGVRLLLHRPFEVAVDQRLHRRQQQRRPQPADDRPEHDDRGRGSAPPPSRSRRRRSRAARARRRACGRSGRRPCSRSG